MNFLLVRCVPHDYNNCYNKAICIDSNNPQPYFYRAKAHFGKGNNWAGMSNYMQGFFKLILFGGSLV